VRPLVGKIPLSLGDDEASFKVRLDLVGEDGQVLDPQENRDGVPLGRLHRRGVQAGKKGRLHERRGQIDRVALLVFFYLGGLLILFLRLRIRDEFDITRRLRGGLGRLPNLGWTGRGDGWRRQRRNGVRDHF